MHFECMQAEQDGNPGVIAMARADAKSQQADANYHHGLCALGEAAAGEVARKAAAMQDLGRQIVATEDALKAAVKRCEATQDVRQQLQVLKAARRSVGRPADKGLHRTEAEASAQRATCSDAAQACWPAGSARGAGGEGGSEWVQYSEVLQSTRACS